VRLELLQALLDKVKLKAPRRNNRGHIGAEEKVDNTCIDKLCDVMLLLHYELIARGSLSQASNLISPTIHPRNSCVGGFVEELSAICK